MNNNNKLFSLSGNGIATEVLPHCAECMVVNRRFAPVKIEEGEFYSDPSSGVFRLEVGNKFAKPIKKGYNLMQFELREFARQQKKKLFCKTA